MKLQKIINTMSTIANSLFPNRPLIDYIALPRAAEKTLEGLREYEIFYTFDRLSDKVRVDTKDGGITYFMKPSEFFTYAQENVSQLTYEYYQKKVDETLRFLFPSFLKGAVLGYGEI